MTSAGRGPAAIRLANAHVALEPLEEAHRAGLAAAAADPRIWTHMAFKGGDFDGYFDAARAGRATWGELPFAVRLPSGRAVGMTRFFQIDPDHRTLEIGHTWYHPDVWAGAVNPSAKRLLLAHAFEGWGALRVQFLTDILNTRTQGAIARLGATREGVLRAHRIRPDGSSRDSVVFSILRDEWPAVRDGLDARIGGF